MFSILSLEPALICQQLGGCTCISAVPPASFRCTNQATCVSMLTSANNCVKGGLHKNKQIKTTHRSSLSCRRASNHTFRHVRNSEPGYAANVCVFATISAMHWDAGLLILNHSGCMRLVAQECLQCLNITVDIQWTLNGHSMDTTVDPTLDITRMLQIKTFVIYQQPEHSGGSMSRQQSRVRIRHLSLGGSVTV